VPGQALIIVITIQLDYYILDLNRLLFKGFKKLLDKLRIFCGNFKN